MAKFRTSKVGGGSKKHRDTTYSTEKQYTYRSQEEMIQKRKELLQKENREKEK